MASDRLMDMCANAFNAANATLYTTNEATSHDDPDLPPLETPVWVLGNQYSAIYQRDEILDDIRSKIWITYRKGFPEISGTGITSDKGWGCMLRCGQMVLAQALIKHKLGREWRWKADSREDEQYETYLEILRLFADKRTAPYSLHQIAQMGACEGKPVGTWFGPNTIAQALKKLSPYDTTNDLALHVAMDNIVIIEDIKNLCFSGQSLSSENQDVKVKWKPLVLFIPLRLGLSELNAIYATSLRKIFHIQQSLGIIGGRPNHALYFIGYVGSELIYLDPHTTQQFVDIDQETTPTDRPPVSTTDLLLDIAQEATETITTQNETEETHSTRRTTDSYHCPFIHRMNILHMDPSLALCFLCRTEAEFDSWCRIVRRELISAEKQPLFELLQSRPPDLWPLDTSSAGEDDETELPLEASCSVIQYDELNSKPSNSSTSSSQLNGYPLGATASNLLTSLSQYCSTISSGSTVSSSNSKPTSGVGGMSSSVATEQQHQQQSTSALSSAASSYATVSSIGAAISASLCSSLSSASSSAVSSTTGKTCSATPASGTSPGAMLTSEYTHIPSPSATTSSMLYPRLSATESMGPFSLSNLEPEDSGSDEYEDEEFEIIG